MKHLKTYNESIRDKMTPVSDEEVNYKLDQLFDNLVAIGMTEGYTKDEDLVKEFFKIKWDEILEMVKDGWSVDDIYSELQMDLEYYIADDDDDDEEDY